jgi:hypothetical protein
VSARGRFATSGGALIDAENRAFPIKVKLLAQKR